MAPQTLPVAPSPLEALEVKPGDEERSKPAAPKADERVEYSGWESLPVDVNHKVRVVLEPYCHPEEQQGTSIIKEKPWTRSWAHGLAAIRRKLENKEGLLGLVEEERRKVLVVIAEPDFMAWGALQRHLPKVQFPIELRPACHTKTERDQAAQELQNLRTNPENEGTIYGWTLDPSMGGYRVFVGLGRADIATRVRERLGNMANIWFTREFGLH